MSKTIYEIKLKPFDIFFFGGERSFREGEEANYLVRSLYFPQQTTVLGMLRYHLLQQNGLLSHPAMSDMEKKKAEALIGAASFPSGQYGAILQLSPVFLEQIKDNKVFHWLPASKDAGFNYTTTVGVSHLTADRSFIPVLAQYNHKSYYPPLFTCPGQSSVGYEAIFQEAPQVGISKNLLDDAYYKKTSFRFKKGDGSSWAFKFYTQLELQPGDRFESGTLVGGGERTLFKLEVRAMAGNAVTEADWVFPFERPKVPDAKTKIVLKSSSMLDPEKLPLFDYAISETEDFRFLMSNVHTTSQYYNVDKKPQALQRSQYRELMKAGSVFYFSGKEAADEFCKALDSQRHFQQIGYNYYAITQLL